MKLNIFTPKKNAAQAMVEFAIVLPILLLLLYGLLEVGRLLFIYSSIVTASRQAVRYGAATGDGINAGVPRYLDCTGIRVAANRVDFLNSFDEYDVNIQWDTGPATTVNTICTNVPGSPPDRNLSLPASQPAVAGFPSGTSTRLIVTIAGDFNPIVPKLLPFIARTELKGNPIIATSARTILFSVPIVMPTPTGTGGGPPPASALTLSVVPTPAVYSNLNDLITYTYTATNTGAAELTGLAILGNSATCLSTTLMSGASTTCTATYSIVQTDIDTKSVVKTAHAEASDGAQTIASSDATATVTLAKAGLSLSKSVAPVLATSGDTVQYTFTLTNTGDFLLQPPYTITDDKMGVLDCNSASGNLAVSATLTCAIPYVVNPSHIVNNQVINSATATALYNSGSQTVTSNTASATLNIYAGALFLTANASPASISALGPVTYTYTLKNSGGSPIFSPYTISGQRGTENCSTNTSSIAPGASITCSGTYTVTQANLDAGSALGNTITVVGCLQSGQTCKNNDRVTSNAATVSVTLVANPVLSLSGVTASPTAPAPLAPPAVTSSLAVDQVITYTYTLTNSGNVTLTPSITDTKAGNITCTAIAPGQTKTCTGTYKVTQADIDAGSITNSATASATFQAQTVTSGPVSATVKTFEGARISLQITANPSTYPTSGQVIYYIYTLKNTGTLPLAPIYTVTARLSTGVTLSVSCKDAVPIDVGASTTCTGQYTTTANDAVPGTKLVNTATVTAKDGNYNTITSNTATVTVSNPVLACNTISSTALVISNNTMSMTITNPNAYAVTVSSIEVSWNHDTGRQGGGGALNLSSAKWLTANNPFWTATGTVNAPSYTITPTSTQTIQGGGLAQTLIFTFSNTYANIDGSEKIKINLATAGCEASPIQQPPPTP